MRLKKYDYHEIVLSNFGDFDFFQFSARFSVKIQGFGHFWSKKWQRPQFLAEKTFWPETIQNGPKHILKRKSRFRKKNPIMT